MGGRDGRPEAAVGDLPGPEGPELSSGFGGGELFWHYWTKDSALDPWTFSQIGAVDRIVSDGAWEGWRYGPGAPIPEPGTALLVALGLAGLTRLRRAAPQPSLR